MAALGNAQKRSGFGIFLPSLPKIEMGLQLRPKSAQNLENQGCQISKTVFSNRGQCKSTRCGLSSSQASPDLSIRVFNNLKFLDGLEMQKCKLHDLRTNNLITQLVLSVRVGFHFLIA